MRKRLVFLAAHLLSPAIASGGDVLFCELAARIAKRRPEWELVALAPDFSQPALSRYFERVETIASEPGGGRQGSPAQVALTWFGRVRRATNSLARLNPDLVHSTGDFFVDVRPAAALLRARPVRWSGVVHHVNAPPFVRRNDPLVSTVSFLLQRASFGVLRTADSISVLNTGVRAQLREQGFDPARIHIVGAGIDVERFPLADVMKRERRAVWLNRLEPTKGMFDLPKIVAMLPPDIAVDVIGGGPAVHVDRLKRLLNEAGVADRCIVHGYLEDDRVREMLGRAAAFISCSYEEGWGISIAEALAMGLPCVAYNLPSHHEIFGADVRTVPLGDAAAFASAVRSTIDGGDTQAARKQRRSSARMYSLDACAERQEAAFAALLGSEAA